jgi:hypothetical protein
MSTAFHPQSDGQSEAINKVLEQYLRIHCNYQQDDWEFHLPLAEVCHNNSVNTSTGMTPWYANKGYHPRTASTFDASRKEINNPAAHDFAENLRVIQEELKENLAEAQANYKRFYDKNHRPVMFQEGDMVFLSAKNIKVLRPSKKLSSTKLGPYKVEKIVGAGKVAAKLALPKSMKIHPVFHFSLLELKGTSKMSNRTNPPPPPVEVEGEDEYEVEEILDSRITRRKLQYFATWIGYDESENMWISRESAENSPELVEDFHRRYPDKPSPTNMKKQGKPTRSRKPRRR